MQITYEEIMSFNLQYDLSEIGMTENHNSKVSEFIAKYRDKFKNKRDIFDILCRNEFMSGKDLRLFAVWCARQIQHLVKNEISVTALKVAERYVYGLATDEELSITYRMSAIHARRDICGASYATLDSNPRLAALDAARAACEAAYKYAYAAACSADFPKIDDGNITTSSQCAWKNMQNSQIDKLLEFFAAKENNQEFDWK